MKNLVYIENLTEKLRKNIDKAEIKNKFYFGDEKIITDMTWKFDAVIGNPPYQERHGTGFNGQHDVPVYHLFYDLAFSLAEKVSLISPARFLTNAGATPKNWNTKKR